MLYRRLGETSLELSVLGFGSSPFGGVYGTLSSTQIQHTVDTAIALGVTFFDTSPYYGRTLAETRLGEALRGRRQHVILATKCGRNDVAAFDFSRAAIRRSVEASLRRLQTDHVDLLQAHDVEFASPRQILDETIPALRELQQEGKTRFIGITGYPVPLLHRLAAAAPVDSILSYCRYALLNTDMQATLAPFAATSGTGLINASPLMMGLLTHTGPPAWHPAPPALQQAARRAAAAARQHGASIETLALHFALHQSFAASTLVGMATPAEVQANVAAVAAAVAHPPDPAVLHAVQQAIATGFPTTWPSGLPENAA